MNDDIGDGWKDAVLAVVLALVLAGLAHTSMCQPPPRQEVWRQWQ